MRNFDPVPDAVTYFRINAIGFGVSILAMFVAMFWWLGQAVPIYSQPIVVGVFAVTALFTAGLYLVPAAIPRKTWGYVVGWIQIAFALTSMTATLPTLLVVFPFARDDVKLWFDGRPLGFAAPSRNRAAVITALVGYYVLLSAVPFGVAAWIQPDVERRNASVVEAVANPDVHVVAGRQGVSGTAAVADIEEFAAERLTTGEEWTLAEVEGPVAVTVWATYCGSCTSQMRALGETPLGHETKHVTLALDCDRDDGSDNRRRVRSKLVSTGIAAEPLCATDSALDVRVLPTTIFFDGDGRRRATLEGYQSPATLAGVASTVEAF